MVHTRPIEPSDLAHLPRIATSAYSDAHLFNFWRPYHAQYPHYSERNLLRLVRRRAVTPSNKVRVAVADDTDSFVDLELGPEGLWARGSWIGGHWVSDESDSKGKVAEGRVLGYSVWERHWPDGVDASKRAKELGGTSWPVDSLSKRMERALFTIEERYAKLVVPDLAADPDKMKHILTNAMPQVKAIQKPIIEGLKGRTGHIVCAAAIVDPTFQRCGVGSRMMRWGLERSEKEGAPILLFASESGKGMYEKLGFEALGSPTVEPLATHTVMVYWPKGTARIEAGVLQTVELEEVQREEVSVVDLEEVTQEYVRTVVSEESRTV